MQTCMQIDIMQKRYIYALFSRTSLIIYIFFYYDYCSYSKYNFYYIYFRLFTLDLLKRCKDINHWPNFLRNPNLTDILLESFNGFILACDEKSEIVFASDTITEVLGYKLVNPS